MTKNWIAAVLVVGLGLGASALAQTAGAKSSDPAVLLQAAMHIEQVEGRLAEAIEAYKNVIAKAGSNKAVAAQAMLQLGAAYEKLGQSDARATYERLVKTYPDEPAAREARARLAKPASDARAVASAAPRRLLDGHEASVTDVTPDGRLAVGTVRRGYSRFDIVLRDLTTGRVSTLVQGETGRNLYQPRISRDGRFVAFGRTDEAGSSLGVIGTEPGAVPRFVASLEDTSIHPASWSAQSNSLLVAVMTSDSAPAPRPRLAKLAWTRMDTGEMRDLKVFEGWQSWEGLINAKVSPDGRRVAYTRQPQQGSVDRYLEVIDAEGTQVSLLAGSAANRRWPIWTPDSASIVFVQAGVERQTLCALPARPGTAPLAATVLAENFEGKPLDITPDGRLLSRRSVDGGNYAFLLDRRPMPATRVEMFEGFGASWSPDGRSVAFTRNRGDNVVVVVRDVATGQERSYSQGDLGWVVPPQWSADGQSLTIHLRGRSTDGDSLHRLDLRTGVLQKLTNRDSGERKRSVGVSSPDGRTLYFGKADETGKAITEIVAVDTRTGLERTVTTLNAFAGRDTSTSLALSRDGRQLAVMTYTNGYQEARIFTVGIDGTGRRDVVKAVPAGWVGNGNFIQWSTDDRSIVFVAFDAQRNWRVMRVSADSGVPEPDGLDFDTLQPLLGEMRLFPGNFNGFDISPDGTRIAVSNFTVAKTELWALDNLPARLARR